MNREEINMVSVASFIFGVVGFAIVLFVLIDFAFFGSVGVEA